MPCIALWKLDAKFLFKINPDFVRDLMQSATRVNYASNMAYIHGLEAMVSLFCYNTFGS